MTEQARRRPDAVAVTSRDERLTYAELDRRSARLAGLLRDAGCRRGERVALLVRKSPAAIVALHAVSRAGAIYAPIDLGSPAPRVAKMLGVLEPRCVLAGDGARPLLDALARADGVLHGVRGVLHGVRGVLHGVRVGWLEADAPPEAAWGAADEAAMPDAVPDPGTGPDDIAYILFTSGSTGVPKGVPVTHGSVAHFVAWAQREFGLDATDRVSGHSPLHFDLSVFDMFGAFAAGAELHLVPDDLKLLAHRLAEWIRVSALTQWFSVPSVLSYLARFDAVRQDDFPSLRRVLWCGDVLPTPVLAHWMRRLPHARFTNLYGPTEATIASSAYTVPACPVDETAPIPIGTACDGEELLVLDECLAPVPAGVIGDLYIRGVGLSPGYWRDEERTRDAFVYPPGGRAPADRMYRTGDLARRGADGLVYFLGRSDSQVKSRGHRIELGEIETALHAAPEVADCAVVAIPTGGFEGVEICCAYVPAGGADASPVVLRRVLAQALPAYMLPSRWLPLERLPVNGNGKIDRPALRALFRRAADAPLAVAGVPVTGAPAERSLAQHQEPR